MCLEYQGRATFALIYLEEAHPTDGWMMDMVSHQIKQHTSALERHAAAAIMHGELETVVTAISKEAAEAAESPLTMPSLLVDSMENLASTTFGALPERLVILYKGEVMFLGGKGPEDYSVEECRAALATLTTA